MVYLIVTPSMRKQLTFSSHDSKIIDGSPPLISHRVLEQSLEDCKTQQQQHESASSLIVPHLDSKTPILFFTLSHAHPPLPRPPNKELQRRLTLLREREEDRIYGEMVRDVGGMKGRDELEDMSMRFRGIGGWVGLDVIVTMGTGFAIGWFCGGRGKGGTWGLVGGLLGLILGLLVEGCLVMVRMVAMERSLDGKGEIGLLNAKRKATETST